MRVTLLVMVAAFSFLPSASARSSDGATALRSLRLQSLVDAHLAPADSDGFWTAVEALSRSGDYPILEDVPAESPAPASYVRLTFLHRSDREPANVLLFAGINHVLATELLFERIGETDIYYKTVDVPAGVRFQYRIIENDPLTGLFAAARYGTRMHLLAGDPDPLNPRKRVFPDGLGEGEDYTVTWVELPGASAQPYVDDLGNPHGVLLERRHESAILGYGRNVQVFLPPGHDPERTYPLLILFDGSSYFGVGHFQRTMENLIADGSVPPMIVLGVDAGVQDGVNRRNDELTCDPTFARYLIEELVPWLESEFRVSEDPDRRVIAGSSFGGLFATYFAFEHPEIVRNVLSQSGSFHWGRKGDDVPFEWLIREFAFGAQRPVRIFMEVGLLEGEYSWYDPQFPHQIVSHRHFETILNMRGYDATYREFGGGHEMLSWQGGIADALTHLCREMHAR